MLKRLPIGIDDFEKLISDNYYFVDKSIFIKELLDRGGEAIFIPRPRRFGKTLNLSMLKCFFEKTEKSRVALFDNLAITQFKDIMAHQGQYPVIFLTLKSINSTTWDSCFNKLKEIISHIYRQHHYLLEDFFLDVTQKRQFEAIIALEANQDVYELSLKRLIEHLSRYHQKRPIVLIDEYDVPVHIGFQHGYYEDVVRFIRSFFGDAIKGNNHLKFAVITGALRIAKESVFTDMNNLSVSTMLSDSYADKFGLLAEEVNELLSYYGLQNNQDKVRSWYNGYTSGSFTVYNPWSIINLAKERGILQPYWVNTSANDIVKKLIKDGGGSVKKDIELLILRSSITKEVRESIVYSDIGEDQTVLWNFLLFSGYLTYRNMRLINGIMHADFLIPNDEVAYFFKATIMAWFKKQAEDDDYSQMLKSLIVGDISSFSDFFTSFVLRSFSFFDVSGNEPEKFYHAFVLGMLVNLEQSHKIRSNRESGYGRYDVALIPNDKASVGIVIEFKKVNASEKETIEQTAKNALLQIKEKQYAADIIAEGIKSVIAVGIAFDGKKVLIQSESCK